MSEWSGFFKRKGLLNYFTPVNLIKHKLSEFASNIKMSLEISNQNTLSIVSVRKKNQCFRLEENERWGPTLDI